MSMNQFEKRMSTLRRQYAAERAQITKDAYRHIGHLNNAISRSDFPEVREALRAEKERVYEAMRSSNRYNRLCYLQQLEAIEAERRLHFERTPSKSKLRRLMASLSSSAEAQGQSTITIQFGDNKSATISFT